MLALRLVCLLGALGLTFCHPAGKISKDKRQAYDSDFMLMKGYWDQTLPLGFFVNAGAADPGGAATSNSVRDKIERYEGSGGGESKRDDIEPKPTAMISLQNAEAKNNNEKISSEETGALHSKIEKDASSAAGNDADTSKTDPSDKKKVRSTITCQGQKEWLQCDGPYELIKIKNAFWGRDNDFTCTKNTISHGLHTDKTCAQDEANTMNKVREACDNENVCEVVASGVYFDKADCSDIYKYLRMEYECAPSESRIKEPVI